MLHLVEILSVYSLTDSFLRQDWLQKILLKVVSFGWTLMTSFRFEMSLEQFAQVLLGRADELPDEMYSVMHGVEQKS